MAFFRKMLQSLFGWFGPRASHSGHFMVPEEAKRRGYKETPGGLQWSPALRQPVDRSHWKPCHGCGRLIPVTEDWVTRTVEVRTAGQRTSDPDGTIIEEGVSHPIKSVERLGTWTSVCPYCGHCHVLHFLNSCSQLGEGFQVVP
jgi:sarcosine oxidase delta subunit